MATDLHAALADLSSTVAWAEPDAGFVGDVTARLAPRRRRKLLVAGAIAAVVGVGLSPALADRFAVEHVRVKEVDQLPAATDDLELGRPVSVAEARAAVTFPLRLPTGLGRPDGVHVGTPPGGVTLRWRQPDVLVTQHPGELAEVLKMVPQGSRSRPVSVDGTGGLWLTGPHVVTYTTPTGEVLAEPPRRTGNTLVWSRDGVLTRIEVDGPLREAQAVAASLQP